jgi:hypothetical protein
MDMSSTYSLHTNHDQKVRAGESSSLFPPVFLYSEVLDIPIDGQIAPVRTKRHPRPAVVLTQNEVKRVLDHMQRNAAKSFSFAVCVFPPRT